MGALDTAYRRFVLSCDSTDHAMGLSTNRNVLMPALIEDYSHEALQNTKIFVSDAAPGERTCLFTYDGLLLAFCAA